ncbi:hypothetical protein BDEG_27728 [Batrachochytrium dendrobatidis JEL423]|uniref:Uncharacterized protein n=1 Tax=Batrachochytrium dendrobatidis (strain JEL423) TaxID=403673 RepID=A0A177WX59_BATDL|nr:hypothetical protein BDEG_27728 [Batrachochytrium dendrobatidis JEL423]
MMKLLIAILSSTLIACSVTTATPVNPSRTTNFESSSTAIYTATATTYPSTSTFLDLNVNSVNCEIVDQKTVVKDLHKRVKLLSPVTTPSDGGPDYMETQSLLQSENDALADLESQQRICNIQHYAEYEKLRLAKEKLARKFFGTFNFSFGRVSSRRMMDLLASQTFLNCFSQFYPNIPSSSTDSEGASTSGTQGSSSRPHGPPPSYGVVMRKPKLYKVTQYSPGDQPPSYQDVVRNPQNFPKVLEDPDVTQSSSMSPSIVHPTQTSSSVPPSQNTASSTLRRVASTLQRASSSMRRVSSTLRRAASNVQNVASSLTWKVDRS